MFSIEKTYRGREAETCTYRLEAVALGMYDALLLDPEVTELILKDEDGEVLKIKEL